MSFSVTKRFNFSYGHRLTRTQGRCANYHGHNGVAEILCRKEELDAGNMVVNFDRISDALKSWIDSTLDHRMILNREDPLVSQLVDGGQKPVLTDGDPTAESIARLIYQKAVEAGLPVHEVTVWETPSSSATIAPRIS
ncbi:MAG: 6-carboxytetrahydropterin synthase [Candidatus Omnitrophica bacterium]|nr:6-carboxytetrahydropterin synthase [Candidatus Omnitrophota bacterium]